MSSEGQILLVIDLSSGSRIPNDLNQYLNLTFTLGETIYSDSDVSDFPESPYFLINPEG